MRRAVGELRGPPLMVDRRVSWEPDETAVRGGRQAADRGRRPSGARSRARSAGYGGTWRCSPRTWRRGGRAARDGSLAALSRKRGPKAQSAGGAAAGAGTGQGGA